MLSNEEKILKNSRLTVVYSSYNTQIASNTILAALFISSPIAYIFLGLATYLLFKRRKEIKKIMEDK